MMVWLALAIVVTVVAVGFLFRSQTPHPVVENRVAESKTPEQPDVITGGAADSTAAGDAVFQTEGTIAISTAIYSLAFSVPRFDYQILGAHREVLAAAKEAVKSAVNEQSYFPRKPALLPKLMRALNAGDSSREEIVRLILQDPMLAGNVLKRANSVYYRHSDAATESVDRAVVILGSEGLRAPVATAILQPVFQLPRGFFDHFAPITWELAQRTAVAAETYARINKAGDTFVAHLLGLLGGLGRLVLFRMTLDKYRKHNILPRAEVFIGVMKDHEHQLTRAVAAAWELSPAFLAAIDAQREHVAPQQMTPLARTLYYANLSGALAVLCARDKYTQAEAHTLLGEQGLNAASLDALWAAAAAHEF